MNRKMVFYVIGQIICAEAVLLLLPLIVSAVYAESCAFSFMITFAAATAIGICMVLIFKPKSKVIYSKEGFVIVALSWVLMSLIGALPFTLSGEIPSYVDAVFETVSGFTTTGASIVTNVEAMSHGTLFWRSFTHWVGGMGVLVLVMAVLPTTADRSIHIIRAEMPGPVIGKLVPRVRQTAKILYLIYIGLTVAQIIFLCAGGMNLFESAVYTFGTAGTGGFGIDSDSLAGYNPYIQWVVTIFLVLFAANFNIYFLMLMRKFKAVASSDELWTYLGVILFSVVTITFNIRPLYASFGESFRTSAFQTMSILSTAGFSTADFNQWPALSKAILLVLMFIGGCAGSTAGGLKVSRVLMLFKSVRREFNRMIHPRSVSSVRLDGRKMDDQTLTGVGIYFALYMGIYFITFLLISFEPFDFETRFSSVAACFNNVGPGFGAVGPMGSYADYTPFSKIVLSISMLLGRLEIYPLIFAIMPSLWVKKTNNNV